MRYPRRWLLFFAWFCAFACCLTARGAQEEDLYWTWLFPSTEGFADMDDVDIWGTPGAAETDYDHLIAYTEYDVYPTDSDEIVWGIHTRGGSFLQNPSGVRFYDWLFDAIAAHVDAGKAKYGYPS